MLFWSTKMTKTYIEINVYRNIKRTNKNAY